MGAIDPRRAFSKNRLVGLLRLMKGNRRDYAAAAIATALSSLAQTATYLLIRFFIDTVLPGKSFSAIALVAAGIVGLAVFQGTSSFFSERLAASTAEGTARRLRNAFFDHLQKLSFSSLDRTVTGDILERATSDLEEVRRFYDGEALGFGSVLLSFVVNIVTLAALSWRLAVVTVIVDPLVLAVSVLFFGSITRRYQKSQEQEAVLTTALQENLTGVRVVKAFARQEQEIARFDAANHDKLSKARTLVLMQTLYWPLTGLLCGVQMLGGYAYGAVLAIGGSITLGTYVAFLGMASQLIWPIRWLGSLIVGVSGCMVSYTRVMSVIGEEEETLDHGIAPADAPLRGQLSFRDVTFGYAPGKPILTGISFDCLPGQSVALLGSTGSGKTSLASLILRFYDYDSGSVLLDGRELSTYARRYVRSSVGIVEQEPFLFSRSLRDNITFGVSAEVSQEEVEKAARSAAIHDTIRMFPDGYETLVGERGVTLSGGQRQRVAIARTLLRAPRILILDDSTSSVDPDTEGLIRDALERLMAGRTTFIIAHRIQSLMRADLILVFDKGRIVQSGTHGTLVEEEGMYRRIFELQTSVETDLRREVGHA